MSAKRNTSSLNRKKIFSIVGLVFLITAIVAGILLVLENQNINEKAAGEAQCAKGSAEGDPCTTNLFCPGTCGPIYQGSSGPYQLCNQTDLGCDNTGAQTACQTDSDCKSPRKCQNGKCIGGRDGGGGSSLSNCGPKDECKSGYSCLTTMNKCIPNRYCKLAPKLCE